MKGSLLRYLGHVLIIVSLGFIGLAVPLGYFIGEIMVHGKPWYLSITFTTMLVLMGLMLTIFLGIIPLSNYVDDVKGRETGGRDEDAS